MEMTGTRSERAYWARKQAGESVVAPTATTPPISGTPPKRTADEQDLLSFFVRERGQAYVDRFAESILEQARRVGAI
jgi:hypothetical protein